MGEQSLICRVISSGIAVSLLCIPCSPALAGSKGGGSSSGIFGGLFVKKDRPFLDVRAGMSMYRDENSYPDSVFNLEFNAAVSRYLNVEVGLGGYNENVPPYLWNGFFSYLVAGAAYTVTSMAGKNDSFNLNSRICGHHS